VIENISNTCYVLCVLSCAKEFDCWWEQATRRWGPGRAAARSCGQLEQQQQRRRRGRTDNVQVDRCHRRHQPCQ